MRSGFTLLEVLIATAISSLLMTMLFFSYNQINNMVRYVTDYTEIFEAGILIEQRLNKDVAGAFIPVQAVERRSSKSKSETSEEKKQVQPQEKGTEQNKVKLLKDAFVSKNAGENISMLSFITANPMRVYWGKKTGEPKPNIVRVVYTLQEDKSRSNKAPRFKLFRQEGTELNLATYTKKDSSIERYLIADNVVSCSVTFKAKAKKEDEKKDKLEIKSFNDWVMDKANKDERSKLKLPDQVSMAITLADELGHRKRSFKFTVQIAAKFTEIPEPKVIDNSNGKKDGSKQQQNTKQAPGKPQSKKEILVSGANSIVQNMRTMFKA